MGYCIEPEFVRVDFFKNGGKYYTTESIKFLHYNGDIYDGFKESLIVHFKDCPNRLQGMWAICLEPYHSNSFPLMVKL